jgi:glycosyltransferase involved in cell wall biosynthesis
VIDESLFLSPDGTRWVDMPPLKILPAVNSRKANLLNIGYQRIQAHLFDVIEAAGGVEFIDETSFGWDYQLWFGWPRSWMVGRDGSDTILHTMFESEGEPGGWVRVMNRMRLIWTPSQWCKKLFEQWGVTTPIMVSGYGVDPLEFPYVKRDWDAPFTFTVIGHDLHGRKGTLDALCCFGELQHGGKLKGAKMMVKTQKGPFNNLTFPSDVNIEFVGMTLGQDEYASFMSRGHVLIYPQRGEGFGLIPLEFMCTGGAAAVTKYSGVMEYLDDDVAFPLPEGIGDEGLKEFMLWAYDNRDRVREVAECGAARVQASWTWQLAGLRARRCLHEHLGR